MSCPPPLPRAGIDPIDDPHTALGVVVRAFHVPPIHETVAVLLDAQRRGMCIAVVSDTDPPDREVDVVECFANIAATSDRVGGMIIASRRPGGGLEPADLDRWMEMNELAAAAGVELVEWFVVGVWPALPRELLGDPPRWGGAA
ncbi:MAG TPA: hypothetical protein VGK49_02655 [Ilumatobacteraceae bacterium]